MGLWGYTVQIRQQSLIAVFANNQKTFTDFYAWTATISPIFSIYKETLPLKLFIFLSTPWAGRKQEALLKKGMSFGWIIWHGFGSETGCQNPHRDGNRCGNGRALLLNPCSSISCNEEQWLYSWRRETSGGLDPKWPTSSSYRSCPRQSLSNCAGRPTDDCWVASGLPALSVIKGRKKGLWPTC